MLRDPTATDAAAHPLTVRPAATPAAAVARAVTPLVAGALALGREFARCARLHVPGDAPDALTLTRCADQLLVSAQRLAGSVRRAGSVARARRGDVAAAGSAGEACTADAPLVPTDSGSTWLATLRGLLAGEHEMARGLRRAIVVCRAHGDDRTADCLEELLEEVRARQAVLSGLLATGDERAVSEPA